jgi:hypothetical protein
MSDHWLDSSASLGHISVSLRIFNPSPRPKSGLPDLEEGIKTGGSRF